MRTKNCCPGEKRCNSSGSSSNLRVLIERRCLARLTPNDDVVVDSTRRSYSYQKLPQLRFLKLSVLKLDGSVFEVHVARNATIAQLKQAIEEVFASSPKEGQGMISWSLIWGYFCLGYQGQKLINDKACISNYGIKEGDQLQFIRHMSIHYSSSKKLPKKEKVASKKEKMLFEEKEQSGLDDHSTNEIQGDIFPYHASEVQEEHTMPQFKMAYFLRGWRSYSRLLGFSKRRLDCGNHPTRFTLQCSGTLLK